MFVSLSIFNTALFSDALFYVENSRVALTLVLIGGKGVNVPTFLKNKNQEYTGVSKGLVYRGGGDQVLTHPCKFLFFCYILPCKNIVSQNLLYFFFINKQKRLDTFNSIPLRPLSPSKKREYSIRSKVNLSITLVVPNYIN